MFTNEEIQYIANAVNDEVKKTGLQNAAMALTIVAKLQEEAQRQAAKNKVDEPDEPKKR